MGIKNIEIYPCSKKIMIHMAENYKHLGGGQTGIPD